LHVLPTPQSADVEHSMGAPASDVASVHSPSLQRVPFGQSESPLQFCSHPLLVHFEPLAQSESLVHGVLAGGETVEQPYPSHV
jgi:hypothetical protein